MCIFLQKDDKECYLLSMKELLLTTIMNPEVVVNNFFCLCVCFLFFCIYAVKGNRLEPR